MWISPLQNEIPIGDQTYMYVSFTSVFFVKTHRIKSFRNITLVSFKRVVFCWAAHCVSEDNFGKAKKYEELRLRVPLIPWDGFPQDSKNYKAGWENTKHLFDEIVVQKDQIFIHKK